MRFLGGEVIRAGVGAVALGGGVADGGLAADAGRDGGGLALEDLGGQGGDPALGVGVALVEERPGGFPGVLDVDEVADHGGPLSASQAQVVLGATPSDSLDGVSGRWQRAAKALLDAFAKARHGELAAVLDDYARAADLIKRLRDDIGGQVEWHDYQRARKRLARFKLTDAIDFCIAERVSAGQVPQVIERAMLQAWADYHLQTDKALQATRAMDRDAVVTEYRELDRELVSSAVGTIIQACNERRPRADIGAAATIRTEANKQKRHMPIRTLLERTATVSQRLKPCFMMSPLSVSQFLPPGLTFNVVIFDEASQVSPGDAISCMYRGKALILAGDEKQLPPTRFFSAGAGDDDDEWSDDASTATDFESVLNLAKGSGAFRSLTLRWHYRSRHESLIAFSNASFYEGRLITFPGALSVGPDIGVELRHVDGIYRRGTTRDNPVEAAEVAARVLHHYDTRPGMSLGVVTFSEAQATAIEAAIRLALQSRPDLDRSLDEEDRLQGFFVKSLESVQGDERDVLIFSIGYGPDENGKLTLNFGPLNRSGGWRRLNVAVTRAKYRVEVVSSIRAADLPEDDAAAQGVRDLRRYLDYAERGHAALALDVSGGGNAESPFEESVISVIRSWGYKVIPQVGTAGYRIDIGLRHPAHPGVYALGIECDGAQYHSSRVARARDRLREAVLRNLGWRLHRIWGTAWYRDRTGEEARLREAIEEAIAAPVHGALTIPEDTQPPRPEITTVPATFVDVDKPPWATPYVRAEIQPLPSGLDPGVDGAHAYMVDGIREIAATEGPVHIDVIHERLREAWEIGKIGSRIGENIDEAIEWAGLDRNGDGDFILPPAPRAPVVRMPTGDCRRGIEQVHASELTWPLVGFVPNPGSISKNELITRVARLYGWKRVGTVIEVRLEALIEQLRKDGMLTGSPDSLTLGKPLSDLG